MPESPLDRVQQLFDQAVALPLEQRSAFLDSECAGDTRLRFEVESLLTADAGFVGAPEDDFLTPALVRPTHRVPEVVEQPPTRVGRYRILRRIAEGGVGVVYEAEQDSPSRLVALKIVRSNLESANLRQRLVHESQILARLRHHGIAQVFDAGIAEDGRPYFAMELIRGVALDEYGRTLAIPARLELLARVCDAVQHAHDHGVIHRDLKPANMLVDEFGQPKVLDFGVARLHDAHSQTRTDVTQTGQLLGTLDYMSPEQLKADPEAVDHRSDVYSLGLILFELLVHQRPYRLENRSVAEVARLIAEEDPPRLGTLKPMLRGDIETIVAHAIEKEPARRYASAAEFAADLRRYLAHQPILARQPSSFDHLGKFVRRNRALVGGAAATSLALVVGLLATIVFAIGEARQRGQAEANARDAQEAKRDAEFQTYRSRIAAAIGSLAAHDVADARRHLDAAPPELRGWEWRYLESRLDDSSMVLPLQFSEGSGAYLTGAPGRLRVGDRTSDRIRLTDLEGTEHRSLPAGSLLPYHHSFIQTDRGLRVAGWLNRKTFAVLDEMGNIICRAEVPELKHPQPLTFSPDGSRLVFAHWSEQAWRLDVFDAITGKRAAICEGHRGDVWACAFSPDGTRLASVSEDRTARIWNPTTGELLVTCIGHTGKVLGVVFHPDGKRIATASTDGTVRQWDAASGLEVEAPYERHVGEVAAVAYGLNGAVIASAGSDHCIRVWKAAGRTDINILHGHTGPVVRLAFTPDGRRLGSMSLNWIYSSADDTVRVWDLALGESLPVLRGHAQSVYPVAFSPDGRWLASGSWDATVRLWDTATGESCATLTHSGTVPSLAYDPTGRRLITGNHGDNRLRVWDTATGRVVKELEGPLGLFQSVIMYPDGRGIAATAESEGKNRLVVCDVLSGEWLLSSAGRALAYSPDGRRLAILAEDNRSIQLLDARTFEPGIRLSGHESIVRHAAFSPDSRVLASCGQDRTVRLWEIDTGECRELKGHSDEVFAVAFHPDGTRLASAGRDTRVLIWDLPRGEEVARFQGHSSYVWSLSFSPDGSILASGSGDSTVRLWDTKPVGARRLVQMEGNALRLSAVKLVEERMSRNQRLGAIAEEIRADQAIGNLMRHQVLRELLKRGQNHN